MSELQIVNGTKNYGTVEVLKKINLDIEDGEFVVFVGPSGCGKSTLLRMISGLEDISSGEIRLGGKVVNAVEPAKRGVAMVFQSYALYPHMTVAENMGFSLKLARTPKAEVHDRVSRAAAILRLENLLDRKPAQLSGGQKQRVAIGRAIVREPKVFLFDEPLSNLDTELRVQMRAELIQLHDKLRSTMIYVTHDQVEAMTLADKMVVMNAGVIQQCGRPLDIYDDPNNKFVAGFIGSPRMSFLTAEVTAVANDSIDLALNGGTSEIRVPFRNFDRSIRKVEVGIRPEHVALHSTPADDTLKAAVSFVEELGDSTLVHADLQNGERLVLRGHGERFTGAVAVHAAIDPLKVLVFDPQGKRLRNA